MPLTSEQVHWLFGGGISMLAILLNLKASRRLRARWLHFVLPGALVGAAVALFLDPWIHGALAPGGYEHETAQHRLLAVVLLALGGVELLRVRGLLAHRAWGLILPVGVLAAGALFFFHAQHTTRVPMILLLIQHRVLGVTLGLAGIAKAVAVLGREEFRGYEIAWTLLLLLVGVELLLYTEGGSALGGSAMESAGHHFQ